MTNQNSWLSVIAAVAAILSLLALCAAYSRHVVARARAQMEVRCEERVREAKERHDTLLQSVQGLVLRFQAVAEKVLLEEEPRTMLDKALEVADQIMVQGRNRVDGVRGLFDDTSRDLSEALGALRDELGTKDSPSFRVWVFGVPRSMDKSVREEVYRIGREAVINALRHSKASAIEIEMNHERRHLRVCFRDNGIGMDQFFLDAREHAGHWGLRAMQERTLQIGGRFAMWSRSGAGVELEVQVPAYLAYSNVLAAGISASGFWRKAWRRP